MAWLSPFSLSIPFLRDPGNPGKCELCDQGAKMSWDKRLLYPEPTWEMPAVPTALQGGHRFLLFLSESFRK